MTQERPRHEYPRIPGQGRCCATSASRCRAAYPAFSVDEAVKAAQELGGPVWVVKAQIHAGGRGKAGGVKVVKSIDDVRKEAQRILGSTLVTHQTGPHGKQVNRLYIEEGSAIEREFYLSMLVDRETLAHRLRRLDRRRHGHRGGRAHAAGQDPDLHRSIRRSTSARSMCGWWRARSD